MGHHQLVSNSATQVKDEEIYAAMNAVCEIFGDAETTSLPLPEIDQNGENIQMNDIRNDEHLIDANYLTDDMLNADIMTDTLSTNLLEHDDATDTVDMHQHSISHQISITHCQQQTITHHMPNTILEHSSSIILDNKNKTTLMPTDTPQLCLTSPEIIDDINPVNKFVQFKETSLPGSNVLKQPNRSKLKKKKNSKTLKSREDLDKFLEEKNLKRKAQKASGEKNQQGKRKKQLIKLPEQCYDCGKTFTYPGYLDAHMRTHTGERPFNCNLCKLKFAQAGNLALHMRVHTGERPYQCEICSKLFTTSSNLKAHLRIHSEARDFKCNQCDRAFKSTSELLSHSGTHTGVKNHVCKLCGKAFYKTSYLNVHVRAVHVGEKRHRCSECGKEFSNGSNLTCHFR